MQVCAPSYRESQVDGGGGHLWEKCACVYCFWGVRNVVSAVFFSKSLKEIFSLS